VETTKDIDQDVATLQSALARREEKFEFHCHRQCKVIVATIGLMLLMFLFGILTRPAPTPIVVQEVVAVLNTQAEELNQVELDTLFADLYLHSTLTEASFPTLLSTATEPAILTWTPASVGRVQGDGTLVPLVGSYTIPAGWFGAIRLTADGEDIGVTYVDARSLASPAGEGRFSITPTAISGEHLIHLSFDAVKACRIACDPTDQLCLVTNVNYCTPLSDNQSLLTYTDTLVEQIPPAGSCIERTFVAGPKYAPQIPEDYTMCEKGMWNQDLLAQIAGFADKVNLPSADKTALLEGVSRALSGQGGVSDGTRVVSGGQTGEVKWTAAYTPGNGEQEIPCFAEINLAISCAE